MSTQDIPARTITARQQLGIIEQVRHYKGDAFARLRTATDADWARADGIARLVGHRVQVGTTNRGTVDGELLAATALGVWIKHPFTAHIRLDEVSWVSPADADGGPHDVVGTAVRTLLARRPYTRETDALVTLLTGLTERHTVTLPKCACGRPVDADEGCPEMGPVLDLAEAIVADDRRELVDHGVAQAALGVHAAAQGGGA